MKKAFFAKYLLFFSTLFIYSKIFSKVKPNSLFSDNMVLQRGVAVPVWGMARDGEKITVRFNGQKKTTVAKDGKWMVKLKSLKASNKPSTMTIIGDDTITINNILVGEVWVCSGQSNMEMSMTSAWPKHINNWQEEIAAADYPEIRQYHVARKAADTMVDDARAKWAVCDTVNVKDYSAVGYFFARDLYKALKVPIGLLFAAWGGTPAENWTPRSTLGANPAFKPFVDNYYRDVKNYPQALDSFNANKLAILAKWASDTLAAKLAHKPLPRKPNGPRNPEGGAGGLYNAMIHPLIPYQIKGVIWYQGESNWNTAKLYRTLFPTMITDWRKNWGLGEFPFLYVQIAPYGSMNPEIREAQLLTLDKLHNVGMATTTDCGDSLMIHPTNKQPVGNRLQLAARALAYKERVEYSGPLYKGFEIKGSAIEISFTHIGKRLVSKDGELKGFTISGDGKKFVPAQAAIKGDKVVVSSMDVAVPTAVRYGWCDFPVVNLFNEDGLPASPFRTDVD